MTKLLDHIKSRFKIVVVDTEFQSDEASEAYCTKALCAVYKDLSTGQIIKIWDHEQGNLAQHHFDFNSTIFVCWYGIAEAGYFLQQLMGRPPYMFDCWTEYAKLYKNRRDLSLLAAATAYAYPNPISKEEKDRFRDMCIEQNTWTESEKEEILNYCKGDVLMNEHVFYKILNDLENICGNDYDTLLEQALARGQIMACYAKIQRNGIPIDNDKVQTFNEYWSYVKHAVIQRFNKELNLWDEDSKFSNNKFYTLIKKLDLLDEWPRTPKNKLKINEDTLNLYYKIYPEIHLLRRITNLLNSAKLAEYNVSEDYRYRPYKGFKPFGTHTGRCNTSSKWIFGTAKWGRNFMKPSYGCALVYLDYSSNEAFVGAKLSGDKNMAAAYESGDIYFHTAILAGMASEDDKLLLQNYKDKIDGKNTEAITPEEKSVAEIRKIWKVIVLASNYGQGARGMSKGLKKYNKTYSEVAGLLMKYKEVYKTYFDWTKSRTNHAQVHGFISTSLGWDRHFVEHKPINPRSLMNWSIQSEAGEILRNATIRLLNANIKVCATVHDAFLIECRLPELHEEIAIAKQCMIDAGTYILGEGIRVDATIHYENFKQEAEDQKIFDLIFREINDFKKNSKNIKRVQEESQNVVRGIYV